MLSVLKPVELRVPMMKLSVKGFTLIEVLITIAILAFCLCGLLATYINMFFLSDLSRDFTLATNAVLGKMEEIKKTNFDNLSSFNGQIFELTGFSSSDSKGVIEVTNTVFSDLKRVGIIACFKSRNRTIGNDIQDCTSSPVELVTLIAK